MTTGEIALLAGVDVSTVSNWRRRFDDSFPQPVVAIDGGKRPKFERNQIVEWLAKNPRVGVPRDGTDAVVKKSVFAVQANYRGLWPAGSSTELVGSMAVFVEHCRRTGVSLDLSNAANIREGMAVGRLPHDIADLVWSPTLPLVVDEDLEDLAESLEPVVDLLGLYDTLLMGGVNRLSDSAEQTTPELLSSFLVSLAADNPDGTLYDPAAGHAGVLLSALQQDKAGSAVGVEINKESAKIARRRIYLADANATVVRGNSLLADPAQSTKADLVIVDPPLAMPLPAASDKFPHPKWEFGQPPSNNASAAWLQHSIAHLKPEGTAIVVTAIRALSRDGRDAGIRNELVRRGAVKAVIALPGKVRPNTSIRLAVWILGTPDRLDRLQDVLLVDAGATDLAMLDVDGPIVNMVKAWLKDPTAPLEPAFAVSVPVTELLAPGATLDPKRWLASPDEGLTAVDRIATATTRYERAQDLLKTKQILSAVSFQPVVDGEKKVTLGELQKRGLVSITRGRHTEVAADGWSETFPLMAAKHLRRNADLQPSTAAQTPQTGSTSALLVTPGDVVVRASGDEVNAVVWAEPGWVLGRFMHSIAINDHAVLTADYLAAAISNPTNSRFLTEETFRTNVDLTQFDIYMN